MRLNNTFRMSGRFVVPCGNLAKWSGLFALLLVERCSGLRCEVRCLFGGTALQTTSSIPRVTTKGCLGAIACPPSLLNMSRAKEEDLLHLIHFESDCAHGSQARKRCETAAPPSHISQMKLLPTRATLDQMSMTTRIGWR